jgi:hypothetical protein
MLQCRYFRQAALNSLRVVYPLRGISTVHYWGSERYGMAGKRQDISSIGRYISLKYQFREEEPRQRFRAPILKIMNNAGNSLSLEVALHWAIRPAKKIILTEFSVP